jgi:hypothetical protein
MIQKLTREECGNKTCHYCDTWLSVKNKIHTKELDRVYYGVEGYVYCCDKCAKKHYIGSEE